MMLRCQGTTCKKIAITIQIHQKVYVNIALSIMLL